MSRRKLSSTQLMSEIGDLIDDAFVDCGAELPSPPKLCKTSDNAEISKTVFSLCIKDLSKTKSSNMNHENMQQVDNFQTSELIYCWDRDSAVAPDQDEKFKRIIRNTHNNFSYFEALILTNPITSTHKKVQVGDGVLVSSGEADKDCYVARVDALFDNGAAVDSKMAFVTWFFTPDEIPKTKRPAHCFSNEVFLCLASSEQVVDAETIVDVCKIEWIPEKGNPPDSKHDKIFCCRKSFDGRKMKDVKVPTSTDGIIASQKPIQSLTTPAKRRSKLTTRAENYRMSLTSDKAKTTLRPTKTPLKSVENSLKVNSSARKSKTLGTAKAKSDWVETSVLTSPLSASRIRGKDASAAALDVLQDGNDSDDSLASAASEVSSTCTERKQQPKVAPKSIKASKFASKSSKPMGENADQTRKNRAKRTSLRSARKQTPIKAKQRFSVGSTKLKKSDISNDVKSESINRDKPGVDTTRRSSRLSRKTTELAKRSNRKRRDATEKSINEDGADDVTSEEDVSDDDCDQEYFMDKRDASSSGDDSGDDVKVVKPKRKSSRSVPVTKLRGRKTASTKKVVTPVAAKRSKSRTPYIPRRQIPLAPSSSLFDQAREMLHVSAVPESLPCREDEFQSIYSFVEGKMASGTGGCMYISGVPGTGKTATVMEVLSRLREEVNAGELEDFTYVEINGMRLTEPHQAYVNILKLPIDPRDFVLDTGMKALGRGFFYRRMQLKGIKASPEQSSELLTKHFNQRGKKSTVLLVDELDLLWTRKQDVMYHIFDWPSHRHARLIVLAIANTMDLPERIMMNRVSSRLGLTRLSFLPYDYKQLQEIVNSRLNGISTFDADAVQLVARKVAAVSGDARRCLDICRRAVEITEREKRINKAVKLVGIEHVHEVLQEMFSSPMIKFIRNCSAHEKLFFRAIVSEFRRSGLEEAALGQILEHHAKLAKLDNMPPATVTSLIKVCNHLAASKLILLEMGRHDLYARVRLNVSVDDILFALNADS